VGSPSPVNGKSERREGGRRGGKFLVADKETNNPGPLQGKRLGGVPSVR